MSNIRRFAANKVEVENIGQDFLKLTIYAIADGMNRNSSIFTLESMQNAIPSVFNKPILAAYNPVTNDTESHNLQIKQDRTTGEYYEDFTGWGSEVPVGLIPLDSDVKIQNLNGRNWLVFSAVLWVNYNRNLVLLLKKQRQKKVSVEVQVLSSTFLDDIETIESFRFHGCTILGNNVSEGIPGAKLSLDEVAQSERFSKFKTALNFAYQGKDIDTNTKEEGGELVPGQEKFVSKDELGKEKALTINTSKEVLSKDAWGSVDKSKLKKACLKASNYKSVCPKVFLKLEDGWDEGTEGSLGYPVMQLKGDNLVYNRAGLASALAYATQHNEKSVLAKLKTIYSKLGLGKKEEENVKNNAKKFGYSIFGQDENHLFLYKAGKTYAAPVAGDDDGDEEKFKAQLVPVGIQAKMEESEEVFEVKMEEDDSKEKMDALEKAAKAEAAYKFEAEEKLCKMEEEKKTLEADRTKMEEEKKELEAKFVKMEEDKKELEAKFVRMEDDAKKMEEEVKAAKMSSLMEEVKTMAEEVKLDAKDFEEVNKMAEEGKFATRVDAEKEIVYRSHLKGSNSLRLGIHDRNQAPSKTKSIFEDLKETVKLPNK